jgi:hypothetical protein
MPGAPAPRNCDLNVNGEKKKDVKQEPWGLLSLESKLEAEAPAFLLGWVRVILLATSVSRIHKKQNKKNTYIPACKVYKAYISC